MKEFTFKINGAEYKCVVEEIEAGLTNVTVNGKTYQVETPKPEKPAAKPVVAPAPKPAAPAPAAAPAAPKAASAPAAGVQVKSPLPGRNQSARIRRPGCETRRHTPHARIHENGERYYGRAGWYR